MKINSFNLALKILMLFLIFSLSPNIAIADNYETAHKIYEAGKEVEAYQKSRIEGTYKDYSETPEWVKLFWSLVSIGFFVFLIYGAIDWIKELPKKSRRNFLLILAVPAIILLSFVTLLFVKTYIEYKTKKDDEKNDELVRLELLDKTLKKYAEISPDSTSNVFDILIGIDPRFSAGKINPTDILNLEGSSKTRSGNYTIIECELNFNCKYDLLPIDHPISANVRKVGFYFCENKNRELLLSGIYFEYGPYYLEKYHNAAISYLNKMKINPESKMPVDGKELTLHFIEDSNYGAGEKPLTNNNGLSFVWVKSDKQGNEIGVDICGNKRNYFHNLF